MTCATDYCMGVDLFWAFIIIGLYLIGVGIAVLREHRRNRMLDRSFNPSKYQPKTRR